MNYREYLHKICTKTDLDDKEDVTALISFLLQEAVVHNTLCKKLESKLMEIMNAKDFDDFVRSTSEEVEQEWINNLPDSDFKDFAIKYADIIADGSLSMDEALAAIRERQENDD